MNRCLCLRFDDDARNRWIRRPDTFRDSNSLARNKPSFVSKIWNDTRAVSTPFFSLFFFFHPLLRSPFHFVTNNSSHEWYGNCAISIAALYRSRKIHSPWLLSLAIKFRIPLPSLFPFFSLSLFFSPFIVSPARLFSLILHHCICYRGLIERNLDANRGRTTARFESLSMKRRVGIGG